MKIDPESLVPILGIATCLLGLAWWLMMMYLILTAMQNEGLL